MSNTKPMMRFIIRPDGFSLARCVGSPESAGLVSGRLYELREGPLRGDHSIVDIGKDVMGDGGLDHASWGRDTGALIREFSGRLWLPLDHADNQAWLIHHPTDA